MEPIIKLNNVSLWYEKGKDIEVKALKNITIDIARGDYVAFFGPSGCGKTTMLYAISGIDHFQEGTIHINEKDISTLTNQELAIFRQTGIGIVFQQFNLVPSLTVLKNVALPMLFVGISSEKADIEAAKLLERLALTEYANRYPFELSGGQQQRVGIARALANDPPIIIADEPLGNLDSVNAKKVLEFLKELNEKDGRTIIMVTHEAWSLRDVKTIYHMRDGTVTEVEHVTPKTLEESMVSHMNAQLSYVDDKKKVPPPSIPPLLEPKKDEKVDETAGNDITAHQLANSLMSGYSLEEMTRFESIVKYRFANKIDTIDFKRLLLAPFSQNGLGLKDKKAEKVLFYVEEVISRRRDMRRMHKMMETNPEIDMFYEVQNLRNWLVEGYTRDLTNPEIKSLTQIISDRIRSYISREKVVDLLSMSVNRGGLGLSFRAAKIFGDKLELVLEGILVDNKSSATAPQGKNENQADKENVNLKKI